MTDKPEYGTDTDYLNELADKINSSPSFKGEEAEDQYKELRTAAHIIKYSDKDIYLSKYIEGKCMLTLKICSDCDCRKCNLPLVYKSFIIEQGL